MAFAGLLHAFIDAPREGGARDAVLGKAMCRVHDGAATGSLPPDSPPKANLLHIARILRVMLGWWIRGLGRPSPFFDARTRAPRAAPQVLDAQQRAALG